MNTNSISKTMKHIFLLLLATLGTLTACACECFQITLTQEVAQSDQIFVGTVLKKNTAGNTYYLFSISKTIKGEKLDTLTVKTGIDSPKCRMDFEVGKTYIVYAANKQTDRCSRNTIVRDSADLIKGECIVRIGLSSVLPKIRNSVLIADEAEYFNADLPLQRRGFDFHQKKIGFFFNDVLISKAEYFDDWGGKDVTNILVMLTDEEKKITNSYDAIIVSSNKKDIAFTLRNRLIERLK